MLPTIALSGCLSEHISWPKDLMPGPFWGWWSSGDQLMDLLPLLRPISWQSEITWFRTGICKSDKPSQVHPATYFFPMLSMAVSWYNGRQSWIVASKAKSSTISCLKVCWSPTENMAKSSRHDVHRKGVHGGGSGMQQVYSEIKGLGETA